MTFPRGCDVVIFGEGIAGLSIAAVFGEEVPAVQVERENDFAYHSSARDPDVRCAGRGVHPGGCGGNRAKLRRHMNCERSRR